MSNALRAGLAQGVAPVPLVGEGAWVELQARDLLAGYSPEARLGLEQDAATGATSVAGRISYARTLAALDVCPHSWTAPWWSFHLCAHGDAGLLRSRALDVPAASRVDSLWGDLGLGASVRLTVAGPVFLDLDARLLFPMSRYTYEFLPSTRVFQVSPATGSFGVSAGVRFP